MAVLGLGGIVGGLIGAGTALGGTITERKNKKRLEKELANAPKYKIQAEAFENKNIAKAEAYGRDPSVAMAQEDINKGAANAATQAQDITNSTSSLLGTLSQIQAQKSAQLRNLASDSAIMRNQKIQNLMGANQAMIDERDKAWNYNVNMPFQNRVAMYRDKIKMGQEMQMAGSTSSAQSFSNVF